jgi:hypothetical protein
VARFLVWKTTVFTLVLTVLTYYVRWFYRLQDEHFGAVHDEKSGNVRWGALFKKIVVDEYLFTPTNVPPVVTLFLFTRLAGRKLFLLQGPSEGDEGGGVEHQQRTPGGGGGGKQGPACEPSGPGTAVPPTAHRARHSSASVICSWLVWVIPHYVLVLITWFPSHLMIYPMPSGVQLPLFMCIVVLSNVLQSYMTMSTGGGQGDEDGPVERELRDSALPPLDFQEWASAQVDQYFDRAR